MVTLKLIIWRCDVLMGGLSTKTNTVVALTVLSLLMVSQQREMERKGLDWLRYKEVLKSGAAALRRCWIIAPPQLITCRLVNPGPWERIIFSLFPPALLVIQPDVRCTFPLDYTGVWMENRKHMYDCDDVLSPFPSSGLWTVFTPLLLQ